MCKKRKYTLFIIVGVMLLLSVFTVSSTVQAKSDIKLKVTNVKQKKNKIFVKMKISNDTKKFIEFSDEIVLYEKRNKKWKKMKWNENHSTSDALLGLEAGTGRKYTFVINCEHLAKKINYKKRYRIGIEIDGKYKKTKKVKIKKRAS